MKKFIVSGMFRSGTTLLARILNTSSSIVCASDPFAPIFKQIRNEALAKNSKLFDENAPLSDYVFDSLNLCDDVQSFSFSQNIDGIDQNKLVETIRIASQNYSPLIHEYLHLLNFSTWKNLLNSCIDVISKSYSKSNNEFAIGFKEVWIGEFTKHLLDLNFSIIHIVRDPRAVIASNFAKGDRYPLLFLIRQWRKLASISINQLYNSKKTFVIRYEDLIRDPKKNLESLVEFLNVPFNKEMINPAYYKDGSGKIWKQNSAYLSERNSKILNIKTINKWEDILDKEIVEYIETLCYFEMNKLNYQLSEPPKKNLSKIFNSLKNFEDQENYIAPWIKPYCSYQYSIEAILEKERYDTLKKLNTENVSNLKFYGIYDYNRLAYEN